MKIRLAKPKLAKADVGGLLPANVRESLEAVVLDPANEAALDLVANSGNVRDAKNDEATPERVQERLDAYERIGDHYLGVARSFGVNTTKSPIPVSGGGTQAFATYMANAVDKAYPGADKNGKSLYRQAAFTIGVIGAGVFDPTVNPFVGASRSRVATIRRELVKRHTDKSSGDLPLGLRPEPDDYRLSATIATESFADHKARVTPFRPISVAKIATDLTESLCNAAMCVSLGYGTEEQRSEMCRITGWAKSLADVDPADADAFAVANSTPEVYTNRKLAFAQSADHVAAELAKAAHTVADDGSKDAPLAEKVADYDAETLREICGPSAKDATPVITADSPLAFAAATFVDTFDPDNDDDVNLRDSIGLSTLSHLMGSTPSDDDIARAEKFGLVPYVADSRAVQVPETVTA